MAELRFGGSVWCNVDIALRNLDRLYQTAFEALEIDVPGAYILRALFEQEGQRPSDLARAIGRAPTSFTPLLDDLERKDLIERSLNRRDRRSINVYLTEAGNALEQPLMTAFREVEERVAEQLPPEQWEGFYAALLALQHTKPRPTETGSSWLLQDAQPTSQPTPAHTRANGSRQKAKSKSFG